MTIPHTHPSARPRALASTTHHAQLRVAKRIPTSFLDILPVGRLPQGSSHWTYFRQTSRTNNAAPVAQGAAKPVSAYEVERVEDKLTVIAHMSAPIDTYWELDHPKLVKFVQDELQYGLKKAVEQQLVNGTGVWPQLTGIAATSGVQTQAFVTDMLTTIRHAQLKLEVLGYQPGAIVFHPEDWLTIELLKNADGMFLMGVGGQAVAEPYRGLFGTGIVTSTVVTKGTAWLIGNGSLGVMTDAQGVRLTRGTINDDFQKNTTRLLLEGRYGLEVIRPMATVKAALTA